MTKNMKLSDWENYASDLGGEIVAEMDPRSHLVRYFLVFSEVDGLHDDEAELKTHDHGDTYFLYDSLDYYRERILKKLASKHPECLRVHSEIKNLAPLSALKSLLDAGYYDISYGNDECPSYYKEYKKDECGPCIYLSVYDDVNEDGERVSEVIKFNVHKESEELPSGYVGIFDTIEEAIKGGES